LPNLGLLKRAITDYHDSGRWEADIAIIANEAMMYLNGLDPTGKKMAVVFDIDETSLSNWPTIKTDDYGYISKDFNDWVNKAEAPAIIPVRDLYQFARKKGFATFFVTGRPESQRGVTEKNLKSGGYSDWDKLFMKPDDYHEPSVVPYKSGARREITQSGFRIVVNIGDQESDLQGGWSDRTFKVPNPAYFIP
jgi:acid phosphatase